MLIIFFHFASKYFTVQQDYTFDSKKKQRGTDSKMMIYSSAQTEGRDVLSSAGGLHSQFGQSQGIYISDKPSMLATL